MLIKIKIKNKIKHGGYILVHHCHILILEGKRITFAEEKSRGRDILLTEIMKIFKNVLCCYFNIVLS